MVISMLHCQVWGQRGRGEGRTHSTTAQCIYEKRPRGKRRKVKMKMEMTVGQTVKTQQDTDTQK